LISLGEHNYSKPVTIMQVGLFSQNMSAHY